MERRGRKKSKAGSSDGEKRKERSTLAIVNEKGRVECDGGDGQ